MGEKQRHTSDIDGFIRPAGSLGFWRNDCKCTKTSFTANGKIEQNER